MRAIRSEWYAAPASTSDVGIRNWSLYAAGLALSAYLVINLHLPTDDDWMTIVTMYEERGNLLPFAFRPLAHHWHPLFFLGPSVGITLDGLGPFGLIPIRLLNAVGLFGSVSALAVVARALGISGRATAFGMALFTFHQATVGVLHQWDSFGHLWGDAIARWAFVMLVLSALGKRPRWAQGWLGTALVGLSTLVAVTGTERVLGTVCGSIAWFIPTAAHALLLRGARDVPADSPTLLAQRRLWKSAGPLLASQVLAVLAFLTLRSWLGAPTTHGGRYGIGSVSSTAQNVAQMTYALLTPVSTLKTFDWWTNGSRAYVGLSVAVTCVVGGCLALAVFRDRSRRTLAASAAAASLAACFPTALAGHVSEHYVAACTFFFALLVMFAIDAAWSRKADGALSRRFQPVLALGLGGFLALHLHGFLSKEATAAATGERDLKDGRELFAQLKDLPSGTTLALVRDPGLPRTYSSYASRSGFAVLLAEAARARKGWIREGAPADVIIDLGADGEYHVRVPERR